MRLVVHAGTHKTGTTSFQKILSISRQILADSGVMYPQINDWPQHSYLAWMLQSSDQQGPRLVLRQCIEQARAANCDTILISGEDFENHLVDIEAALRFEALVEGLGIQRLEWVFVVRDPVDYLHSLYSALSVHRVLLNLDEMAEAIRARGYLSVSNSSYNYHFVFAVEAFARHLSEAVKGSVSLISFQQFVADYPGRVLLKRLAGESESTLRVDELARSIAPRNERRSLEKIEKGYALTALGISPHDKEAIDNNAALIRMVAQARERRTALLVPLVNKVLSEHRWA